MNYGFTKCGAYTPNIKVCDVEFNVRNIIDGIIESQKAGIELLAFPELCVTGYTGGDLLFSDVLLESAKNGLNKIVKACEKTEMIVFVGLPIKKDNCLYNVCAVINKGKVLAFVPKTFLPNYNEFCEKRWFSGAPKENTTVDFCGERIPFGTNIIFEERNNANFKVAVEICYDLLTPLSPSVFHSINGANIIVNLSASNEIVGKKEYRESMISNQSTKLICGYVYSNAGSGESTTDVVFSGHNLIAENGTILNQSKLFSTGLTKADIDVDFLSFEKSKCFIDMEKREYLTIKFEAQREYKLERSFLKMPFIPQDNASQTAKTILNIQAEGLKKRIEHSCAKTAVIGLSGGLDSTLAFLVTVLAMQKLGRDLKDITAVTMPCFGTTDRTFDNTVKLAKALGVSIKKIDIGKSVERHLKDIGHKENVFDSAYENAQARERTQVLMDIANMQNGLVVGTGDLSELALGWATYNGDHMSMYGVNCSIPKTLVRLVVDCYANKSKGKLKAVLKDILDTPVSPELLPAENGDIAQKTEDIVGPYVLHDFFLYNFIRRGYSPKKIFEIAVKTFDGDFNRETILKWIRTFFRRFFNQQFKRSCVPDGVKVGTVALSPRGDWKMPSDAVSTLWLNELEELTLQFVNYKV